MTAERRYTDEQRAAVVAAYATETAGRVVELAAAGELLGSDGEPLEAFAIPEDSVRDLRRKAQRAESRPSPLVAAPPKDAVEALRQRLVNLADREVKALEAQPDGKVNLERLRAAGKAVEQVARIPGPTDPRPPSRPTKRAPGGASGQAGALLREHRDEPPQPKVDPAVGVRVSPMGDTFGDDSPQRAPEPERPKVSTEEDPLAGLRADIERVKREQEQAAEPATPANHGSLTREERRRRREPQEDVSSWR